MRRRHPSRGRTKRDPGRRSPHPARARRGTACAEDGGTTRPRRPVTPPEVAGRAHPPVVGAVGVAGTPAQRRAQRLAQRLGGDAVAGDPSAGGSNDPKEDARGTVTVRGTRRPERQGAMAQGWRSVTHRCSRARASRGRVVAIGAALVVLAAALVTGQGPSSPAIPRHQEAPALPRPPGPPVAVAAAVHPAGGGGGGERAVGHAPAAVPSPVPPSPANDPRWLAVRALWRACGWEVPAGARDRAVRRGELARWLVRGLLRPAPEPLTDSIALAMAAGMGWLPPAWAVPAGRGAAGTAVNADQAVTWADLHAVAAAVLAPFPRPAGLAAQGAGHGSSPEPAGRRAPGAEGLAAGAGGDGAAEAMEAVTLGEAMTWYLQLLERAGRLFDGEGVVTAVDRQAGRVWVDAGALRWVLEVPRGTPVYRNGEATPLMALTPGDEVRWCAAPTEPPRRPGVDGEPGAGAGAAPMVSVSYLEAFRWVLAGTLTGVDWETRTVAVALAEGAGPGSGATAPGAGGPGGRQGPPQPGDAESARADSGGLTRPPSPWATPPPSGPGRRGAGGGLPGAVTLRVERDAPVVLNARPAGLAALRPGDRVVLHLRRATGAVRRLQATRAAAMGIVEGVDVLHGVIAVRTAHGATVWAVDAAAAVLRDGRPSRLADLRPGDAVALGQRRPGVAGYVEAWGQGIPAAAAPGDAGVPVAVDPARREIHGRGQAGAGAPGAEQP